MELLVVLAVMGVMMGLIGFSLAGGDGAALSASQRQLLGLIQQTRAKAAIYGQPARLIVNNDETDTDKYHRYLEIVVRDANESKKWRVQGEGKFLEDGVFFIPEDDSRAIFTDDWFDAAYTNWSSEDDVELSPSFKGIREEGGGDSASFRYLEFNPEGNLVCDHEEEADGISYPMLMLASGSPIPSGDKSLRFDEKNSIVGILLRRFGGFAVLEADDFGSAGNGNGY